MKGIGDFLCGRGEAFTIKAASLTFPFLAMQLRQYLPKRVGHG